jgi:NitT/TauT family transport system ATP-binding protein
MTFELTEDTARFDTPTASLPSVNDIVVSHLTKHFDGGRGRQTVALDDVDLHVGEGEFVTIVGPSGCGKSTLLSIVAGLGSATSGAVEVGGRRVQGPSSSRGLVPQQYTLYPWLRVDENVAYGLRLAGVKRSVRLSRVRPILEEFGLAEFARRYPAQLSGGMQQRAAIARALVNDPSVLLMDEPFGALDSLTRQTAQRILTDIWTKHRKTVLFITHDVEEAVLLSDVVYVMSPRPGKIIDRVEVPLPRPRSHDITDTQEFIAIKRRIRSHIHGDH